MLQGSVVIAIALGYIGLLFVVASYGDRARRIGRGGRWHLIYPLSLAIYCTSWTFFGSSLQRLLPMNCSTISRRCGLLRCSAR